MKVEIIKKRKLYFSFLFASFIYIGFLMILIRKPLPFSFDLFVKVLLSIGALTPAFIFFLKRRLNYKLILAVGHFPLLIGFVLSVIYQNMIYFLIMFPVFILGYLLIVPVEKGEKDGLSRKN